MKPQHQAIAAGLALTLAFGTAATPSTLFASTDTDSEDALVAAEGASADGTDTGTDEAAEELPAPADFDRTDEYEEDPAAEAEAQGMPSIMMLSVNSLMASRAMSIQPTSLSSEMKYFAENESGSNYNQGFSYYDGYNAMGFYQFDRRYSLVEFMEACYAYDPDTYAMFAPVIERGDELRSGTIYDSSTKRLTEIGQLAQDAWHAAYAANPSEFSALQDDFAYQEYYLPVERILRNTYGVDISDRADCVKGLAWGMCNLFGSGGCQKYFELAELSDDMSDRELVNALCDAVVENVGGQWAASYRARYERERATCLEYIAEDEAQNDVANPDEGGAQTPADEDQQPGGNDQDSEGESQQPDEGESQQPDEGEGERPGGNDQDSDGEGEQPGDEGDGQPGDSEDDSSAGGGSSSNGGTTPPANGPILGDVSGDGADSGSDSDSDSENSSDSESDSDSDSAGSNGSSNGGDSSGSSNGSNNGSNSSGSGSNSAAGSTGGSSTESSSSTDADKSVLANDQEKTESDDSASDDTSTSDDKKNEDAESAKKDERTATVDEREKLPATADAASIGLAVSAGLSAIGAGAAVVGKKGRGTRIPFEDGFRE